MTQEAIFNTSEQIEVTAELVEDLKRRAKVSPRGRFRLCLHRSHDDVIQEMLIAGNKGSYFRPHRNPPPQDKSYHVVSGKLIVVFFDDHGEILRQVHLSSIDSGKPFMYRFAAWHWHMPLPDSDTVVYHEVRAGPFNKEVDVEFSTWSLEENDPRVGEFIAKLHS